MAQQYTFSPNAGNIDPSDLISNTFGSPYYSNQNDAFSGTALFGDDELLDGLQDNSGIPATTNELANMNMAFSQPQTMFANIDQQVQGFSNTPDADAMQNHFTHQLNRRAFQTNMHNMQPDDAVSAMQNAHIAKLSPSARMNMGSKTSMSLGASERAMTGFGPQSMTGALGLEQPPSNNNAIPTPVANSNANTNNNNNNWMQPIAGSFGQSFNSGLSSPPPMGRAQINEVMLKAGTSMPTKLGATNQNQALNSQDLKRKRRRESHNLVERRRRDNINDRIQDLSKLVPTHRLEDDKVRKLIQSGTPLSPTLGGSGRRAGSVTTGLPIEDKDKGPNKGDILNGAVGWMRDLLWMNLTLARQREELENTIREMGGTIPFELSEDETRMHSEIVDIMGKCDLSSFTYSRYVGSGLRVPNFTDYKGDPVSNNSDGQNDGNTNQLSLSPAPPGTAASGTGPNTIKFDDIPGMWNDMEDGGGSGRNSLSLREEDEYMDFTNS
ncbi:Helix-loop-helix DNA-binding domain protein [Ceratocystis platani]|uniref:Helix-loop-helix DNA-binding domain protein n=1 Tax=Ceratocystis fimbriata f. sp. platani TaxID=88771 RepID=A0A0F8DLJ5_CERFI|nr:Helix-loop-helix DNA-binding domain protein [Ceratocystis platani]